MRPPRGVNLSLTCCRVTQLATTTLTRFGIDLGGTKTEIVGLDDAGMEVLRRRVPTPKDDYQETLNMIATLVRDAEVALGRRGSIGIGTPGSLSPATGLLRGSNSVCLNGKPIKADLEAHLGREVRIANDANCFALSEATDGAGAGSPGRVRRDLGHRCRRRRRRSRQYLVGPERHCRRVGTQSAAMGQRRRAAGARLFLRPPRLHRNVSFGPRHGTGPLGVAATLACAGDRRQRAAGGDPQAGATLLRYEQRLAKALASSSMCSIPDVIVLGGGLSNIERLYANVPARWGSWVFSERVDTRLVRHLHGDSSGVRGAAWLWSAP